MTKHTSRFLLALLTLAAVAALPGRAKAVVTAYTSPASYAAATTGNTTYNFSGAPVGGSTNVAPSYTNGPLTFAGSSLYLYNDGTYGAGVTYLSEFFSPETITLSGATALSFNLGTYLGVQIISISVNGAPATTLTTSGGFATTGTPPTGFIGFTDTVPITSLTFTNATTAGNEIDALSFQVGTAVVPEPSTWALMTVGTGILFFGVARRRRNTQAA